MSTESTPDHIRAFVIPHDIDHESINESESAYSQAGNRAGDPIPQQASALVETYLLILQAMMLSNMAHQQTNINIQTALLLMMAHCILLYMQRSQHGSHQEYMHTNAQRAMTHTQHSTSLHIHQHHLRQ